MEVKEKEKMSIKTEISHSSVIVIFVLAVPTVITLCQSTDAGGNKSEISNTCEKFKKHVEELKKKLVLHHTLKIEGK